MLGDRATWLYEQGTDEIRIGVPARRGGLLLADQSREGLFSIAIQLRRTTRNKPFLNHAPFSEKCLFDSRGVWGCNTGMLGRLRRTSRLDAGLALAFAGVAYLMWALVAGSTRTLIQEMIRTQSLKGMEPPAFTGVVKVFFVDAGIVIDLAGLAWLAASLLLVVFSSRQKISISWAWVSAICQAFAAAWGAVLVGWAAFMPHRVPIAIVSGDSPWEKVSGFSLPVVLVAALLVWVTFLVWLLVERSRLDRRGPTLRDGLRTNIFR